jgi:acetate kinase
VAIDEALNSGAVADPGVQAPGSAVRVLVIRAREDAEIARQVHAVLGRE